MSLFSFIAASQKLDGQNAHKKKKFNAPNVPYLSTVQKFDLVYNTCRVTDLLQSIWTMILGGESSFVPEKIQSQLVMNLQLLSKGFTMTFNESSGSLKKYLISYEAGLSEDLKKWLRKLSVLSEN